MDQKLVAWGRAVKARRPGGPPPLWLFTDPDRGGDPAAAVAALPPGLCGVVFRHPSPESLRQVARLCRRRRLALVVAGTLALPAGSGRHLRRGAGRRARRGLTTSSAHSRAELIRARRAGAAIAFLSPAFATASHPGAPALGPIRWAALARAVPIAVYALGGITGLAVRTLPRWTAGAAAITALTP